MNMFLLSNSGFFKKLASFYNAPPEKNECVVSPVEKVNNDVHFTILELKLS
jgi:hypothetical protein